MIRKVVVVLLTTLFAVTICSIAFADNSTMFYNTGSSSAGSTTSNASPDINSKSWDASDFAEKPSSKYKYIEYGAVAAGVLAAGGLITYVVLDHHGHSHDDNTPSNPNATPLTPPPPMNIQITNITQSSAAVSWTIPDSSTPISYDVKAIRASDSYVAAKVKTDGLNAGLIGLDNNTNYKLEVTANYWSGRTATANANFTTMNAVCTPKIYVTNSSLLAHNVKVYDTDGNFVTTWGSLGYNDGQFAINGPTGIAVDSFGSIYVNDTNAGLLSPITSIQKFESNGAFILRWSVSSLNTSVVMGMATDKFGNLYVADNGLNKIEKFTANGTQTAWNVINEPAGVATDAEGDVYVTVEKENTNIPNGSLIQKFSPAGTLLMAWGQTGSDPGKLQSPYGIAVDSNGNIYVADTGNNRIQKFSSTGSFILEWGGFGFGNGQFISPMGITIGANNTVYVVDSENHRIQKFNSSGKYITKWATQNRHQSPLALPMYIAYRGCP